MKRTHTLLTGLIAGAASLAGGSWWLLRRPLPQIDGSLMIDGLLDEVEIIRDEGGVPHIFAETAHDLFFAQGFVHAQDRLWQMDFQRRLVAGRLSEVLGAATLDTDRWMRILQLRRHTEADWERASDEARRGLQAYAKGVNRFIETTPALPFEFTLLRYDPEPWTPVDSLSWSKLMAFALSGDWDSEIIRARLIDRLGPERAARLAGRYPSENPIIVPDIDYAALGDAMLEHSDHLDTLARGNLSASNSWAVAGSRSAAGKPLLANDPHLLMRIPGIWYENHLVGGGYNVAGASWAGVPAVLIGHNEHIAWGITAGMADVQDLFIERFHADDPHRYQVNGEWQPAEVQREEIRVRGRTQPEVEDVVVTRHGPIITSLAPDETQPLALRWPGYDPDAGTIDGFLRLNRARNWDEVRGALAKHTVPAINLTYADVDGNIGYQFAGKIPMRRQGNGRVPVPGWTDEHEWAGYVPFDELPREYNPDSGFVVTANNKPVDDDYPHDLGNGFRPGYRARRIMELIESREKHDRSSFAAIQFDQLSIPMQHLAERVAQLDFDSDDPELEVALNHLRDWDGVMGKDAIGATLAHTTLVQLQQTLFAGELGSLADSYLGKGFHPALAPISGMAATSLTVVLDILDAPAPAWLAGRPVDEVLARSFCSTVEQLREELGRDPSQWRWGALNQLTLEHPLGTLPALGRLLNRGPYPAGGDPYTVWPNAARFHPDCRDFHSSSYRTVIDLADWARCVAVCPPGQSGHPASPHYADQIADWQAGRYHPMLWHRDDIEAAAEGVLALKPASKKIDLGIGPDREGEPAVLEVLTEIGQRLAERIAGRLGSGKDLPPELSYDEPDTEYAYTVYWVKVTRDWSDARRRVVASEVAQVLAQPDFEANPVERRYTVPELEGRYSGLSLTAPARALQAWE